MTSPLHTPVTTEKKPITQLKLIGGLTLLIVCTSVKPPQTSIFSLSTMGSVCIVLGDFFLFFPFII